MVVANKKKFSSINEARGKITGLYLNTITQLMHYHFDISSEDILVKDLGKYSFSIFDLSTGSGKTYAFFNGVSEKLAKYLEVTNQKLPEKDKLKVVNFYIAPLYSHLLGNEYSKEFKEKYRNSYSAVVYGQTHYFSGVYKTTDIDDRLIKIFEDLSKKAEAFCESLNMVYFKQYKNQTEDKKYKGRKKLFIDPLEQSQPFIDIDFSRILNTENNNRDGNEWKELGKAIKNTIKQFETCKDIYANAKKLKRSANKTEQDKQTYDESLRSLRSALMYYDSCVQKIAINNFIFFEKNKSKFMAIYKEKDPTTNNYKLRGDIEFLLNLIEKLDPFYLLEVFDNVCLTMVNKKSLYGMYRIRYVTKKEDQKEGVKTTPKKLPGPVKFKGKDFFGMLSDQSNSEDCFQKKYGNRHINVFIDEAEEFHQAYSEHLIKEEKFYFNLPKFISLTVKHLGLKEYWNNNAIQSLYDFLYVSNKKGLPLEIAKWIKKQGQDSQGNRKAEEGKLLKELQLALRKNNGDEKLKEADKAFGLYLAISRKQRTETFLSQLELFDVININLKKLKVITTKKLLGTHSTFKDIIEIHNRNEIRDLRIENDEYYRIKNVFSQIFYNDDITLTLSKDDRLKQLSCVYSQDMHEYLDIVDTGNGPVKNFSVYEYICVFLVLVSIFKKCSNKFLDALVGDLDENLKQDQDDDILRTYIKTIVNKDFIDIDLDNLKDEEELTESEKNILRDKDKRNNENFSISDKSIFEDIKSFMRLRDSGNFIKTKALPYTHLKLSLSECVNSPEYEILKPFGSESEGRLYASYNVLAVSATGGWKRDYINQISIPYLKRKKDEFNFELNVKPNKSYDDLDEVIKLINNSRLEQKQGKILISELDKCFIGFEHEEDLQRQIKHVLECTEGSFMNQYKKEEIANIFKAMNHISMNKDIDSAIFFVQTTKKLVEGIDRLLLNNEIKQKNSQQHQRKDSKSFGSVRVNKSIGKEIDIAIHKDYKEYLDKTNDKNKIYTYKNKGAELTIILYRSQIDTKFNGFKNDETAFKRLFLDKKHENHNVIVIGDYHNIVKGLNFVITKSSEDKVAKTWVEQGEQSTDQKPFYFDFNAIYFLMDKYYLKHNYNDNQENNMAEMIMKSRFIIENKLQGKYNFANIDELGDTERYMQFRNMLNNIAFLKELIQANGRIERTDNNKQTMIYLCNETLNRAKTAFVELRETCKDELSRVSPNNQVLFEKYLTEDIKKNTMNKNDWDSYFDTCMIHESNLTYQIDERMIIKKHVKMRKNKKLDKETLKVWQLLRSPIIWEAPSEYFRNLKEGLVKYKGLYEALAYVDRNSEIPMIRDNFDKLTYLSDCKEMTYPVDVEHHKRPYKLIDILKMREFLQYGNLTQQTKELTNYYIDGIKALDEFHIKLPYSFLQRVLCASILEQLIINYCQKYVKNGEDLKSPELARGKYGAEKETESYEYSLINPTLKLLNGTDADEEAFFTEYPELFELFDIVLKDGQGKYYFIDAKNWSRYYNKKEVKGKKPTVLKLEDKRQIVFESLRNEVSTDNIKFIFINLVDDGSADLKKFDKSGENGFYSIFLFKKTQFNKEYRISPSPTLLKIFDEDFLSVNDVM